MGHDQNLGRPVILCGLPIISSIAFRTLVSKLSVLSARNTKQFLGKGYKFISFHIPI